MKSRSKIQLSLMVLTSFVILYFLLRKSDWNEILQVLNQINIVYFLLGVLFAFSATFVAATRWKILCSKVSLWDLIRLMFISRLYSTILPGQMFGEGSKAVYLSMMSKKKNIDITVEEIASSIIVDKIIGLIGLLIIGIYGCILSTSMGLNEILIWFVIISVIIIVILFLPLVPGFLNLLNKFAGLVSGKIKRTKKLSERIIDFFSVWKVYLKNPYTIVTSIITGAVFQILLIIQLFFYAKAIGIDVTFNDLCWIQAVLSLLLLLPISFAGLGVREATIVGFFALFSISKELSLSYSVVILFVQIIQALIGALMLVEYSLKKYDEKQI